MKFQNIGQFNTEFQKFAQNFNGDPRQQVQYLLDSGKITQEQLNQAVSLAQRIQNTPGFMK